MAWIPPTSYNMAWNIRNFAISTFYNVIHIKFQIILHVYSFLLYNSHCSRFCNMVDNAVEARYKRLWRKKKLQESKVVATKNSLGSLCEHQNEKHHVQTLWKRSESAIETHWHHKGFREVTVQAQSTYHCVSILRLYALLGAPTELSLRFWRPYGTVMATSLRFSCKFIITQSHGAYFQFVHAQSARCRMAFYNVSRRSHRDNEMWGNAVALLRRCWRHYYVYLGV